MIKIKIGNVIAIYQGDVDNIPDGWYLCDGNNGTPDLIDRFIMGADSFEEIGIQGGGIAHSHNLDSSASHTHYSTRTAGYHRHTATAGSLFNRPGTGEQYAVTDEVGHYHSIYGSASGHTHTVGSANNLPEYYVLCYIMADDGFKYEYPIGSIIMYTGDGTNLPPGWHFCNGQGQTIDLRNRFIKGAETRGSKGGNDTHTHTIRSQSHSHSTSTNGFRHWHQRSEDTGGTINTGKNRSMSFEGPDHNHQTRNEGSHDHVVSEEGNNPPFYKLAFIQKIA